MLNEFTNHNVPGSVGLDCFTTFYEGTVNEKLIRINGTEAPIVEWDLTTNIQKYNDDNDLAIIRVTTIPKNAEQFNKLRIATLNARHFNIRLILPKWNYPTYIGCNIDND